MKHKQLQIVRTTAGWHVRARGRNGEPLNSSELLSSRYKAIKNLAAAREAFATLEWEAVDERPSKRAKRGKKK